MRLPGILWVLVAFWLTVATVAPAQHYPADYVSFGSRIRVVHGAGTYTDVYDNPGRCQGGTMDFDNVGYFYGEEVTQGFLVITPPATTPSTVAVSATLFNICGEATVDSDGAYVVSARGSITTLDDRNGLYRIGPTAISPIVTTANIGIAGMFTGGLVRDIDTGRFVLPLIQPGTGPHALVSVAPNGSFTVISTNYTTLTPLHQLCQDKLTGLYYAGVTDGTDGHLLQITGAGAVTTVATVLGNPNAFAALVADRSSAAGRRIVCYWPGEVIYTDLTTFAVTRVANTNTSSPRALTVRNGRNIQTVMTAPGKWDVRFSFPSFAGMGYAAGVTLSGSRPGIGLTDGRTIPANVDPALALSVNGLLVPLFSPGPGILNASGEARGSMDLTSLPLPLNVAVHIVALVIDSTAPLGIGVIADAYVMRL